MHRTATFFYSLFLSLVLLVSAGTLLSVSQKNSAFPKVASIDKNSGKIIVLGSKLPFLLSDIDTAKKTAADAAAFNRNLFPEPFCDAVSFVAADIAQAAQDLLSSGASLFETIITRDS